MSSIKLKSYLEQDLDNSEKALKYITVECLKILIIKKILICILINSCEDLAEYI